MNKIKAIETQYKGYRFRSRLEARWAVFFDALGIEWQYEPEGFEMADGTRYLPDFWLPTFGDGMYVEVKPKGGDFSKAKFFAEMALVRVWLAEGEPTYRAWNVYENMSYYEQDGTWIEEGWWETPGIPNADQAEGENRMFVMPGYEEPDLSISDFHRGCLGETFMSAIATVRSARFEYGETP